MHHDTRPVDDNPLGAEDAARRDPADVHHVFVDVRDLITQPYQVPTDLNLIRVVVGKKGSGKTHILRYIEENIVKSGRDVIFATLSDNAIPSGLEQQFRSMTDRPHARSVWSRLWRIVISLSIVSKFIGNNSRNSPIQRSARRFLERANVNIDPDTWTQIRSELAAHFESHFHQGIEPRISKARDPVDPSEMMQRILQPMNNIARLTQFIDGTDLISLERDVASLVKLYKPCHVIIDGVDEVSWRQPRMWLDFQVGLFDAVFFFHEAQRNTTEISMTVAIRNFVFVAALESPHTDRIRLLLSLNWDPRSAKMFLNRRIQQASDLNFVDAKKLDGPRPLASWLGFESVFVSPRGRNEDVESYFLRHTRLSPRNVIRLFNLLCQDKNRHSAVGSDFGEVDFRRVVEQVAGEVADIMLKTASEEIIAFIDDISRVVTPTRNEGVVNWVATELEESIRSCGMEVIDSADYNAFLTDFLQRILPVDDTSDIAVKSHVRRVEAILWRSNVIAFWVDRKVDPAWVFCWSPQERLPSKPGRIGFHSALISRCDLEISEHGPVF